MYCTCSKYTSETVFVCISEQVQNTLKIHQLVCKFAEIQRTSALVNRQVHKHPVAVVICVMSVLYRADKLGAMIPINAVPAAVLFRSDRCMPST